MRKHETTDANSLGVVYVALGVVFSAIVFYFALKSVFWSYHARIESSLPPSDTTLVQLREPPPEPHLQIAPSADLKAYREREKLLLQSYGWQDKSAQTVHIPVQRAMEILAHGR